VTPEPQADAATVDDDGERTPAARRHGGVEVGVIGDRPAVDPHDDVAGANACPFGGGVGDHLFDPRPGRERLLSRRRRLIGPFRAHGGGAWSRGEAQRQ
jgi:hypothetical protein